MVYKILCHKGSKGKLYVPSEFLADHIFVNLDSLKITAGSRAQDVKVILGQSLNRGELMLSQDVLDTLLIPMDLEYQVRCVKDCIRLGPVIGLLMVRGKNSLTRRNLRAFSPYTHIYPQIHGLLVAFTIEGIDYEGKTVEGYCCNPDSEGNVHWEKGVFPLPDSIFQRAHLPDSDMSKLIKETNNRLFNTRYFDKWDFWKMVSQSSPIRDHIPYTRQLLSLDDIDYLFAKYDGAYLKPVNGTLARGLYKVMKTKGGYVFQGKHGSDTISTSSRDEAENLVRKITGRRKYLVQQALAPLKIDGRHTDFRVIMQKDHTMEWGCTGIISFLGKPGDICSNWGYETTFEDIFAKHLNFSQKEIFIKRQEVIRVCKSICDILDSTGENYADLGFDVVVDENLKVWVLETNKRHYHTVPLWIGDVQTFYDVKSCPIKYAAALSGFKVYQ